MPFMPASSFIAGSGGDGNFPALQTGSFKSAGSAGGFNPSVRKERHCRPVDDANLTALNMQQSICLEGRKAAADCFKLQAEMFADIFACHS